MNNSTNKYFTEASFESLENSLFHDSGLLKIVKHLGEGYCSDVFLVENTKSQEKTAIKVFKKDFEKMAEQESAVINKVNKVYLEMHSDK
jgi:hypothetical protein